MLAISSQCGMLPSMYQRLLKFENQSEEELLNSLLDAKTAKLVSNRFTLAELATAHRPELELNHEDYDRLMAAIELGRRVVDAANEPQGTKFPARPKQFSFARTTLQL